MSVSAINTEDSFLTTAQAAKALNVSVATLKKFVLYGRIKAIKTPGGHYRIRKKDLFENIYK
ncbi:MAG: helix-turn-helix domain-containing protein [Candidatus Omnitrophica bacterium]|nr:helix-turn-helix domain-containing protein [Candidatus Omnitrophota bacterium]